MSKELAEAVKLFISQPLNFPLSRGQIMEVARIALPILEQQERGEGDWIEWGGAIHPANQSVEVKFRAGETLKEIARRLVWEHTGSNFDIIAYRIIPEQQEQVGDGWIEWGGDGIPVDDNVFVEVKWRNGAVLADIADAFAWYHDGFDNDIIAYRIIPEQPTNQNGEQ